MNLFLLQSAVELLFLGQPGPTPVRPTLTTHQILKQPAEPTPRWTDRCLRPVGFLLGRLEAVVSVARPLLAYTTLGKQLWFIRQKVRKQHLPKVLLPK